MPDLQKLSHIYTVRPLLRACADVKRAHASISGHDALHMRLLHAASTQGRWWQKFLARRLQSNWRLFQKIAPWFDGQQRRFSRPSTLTFEVDPAHAKSFVFDSLDVTFRSYYAPKRDAGQTHEPEVWLLLKLLLVDAQPDAPVFYYIGANWGVHGFILAQWPGFSGAIHAFEANPQVAALAADITAQLNLTSCIHIHSHGLSNRQSKALMGGFGRTGDSSTGQVGESGTVEVHLCRLEDLTLPAPTVMKLDVENHEYEVLQGAQETIQKHRPYILLESWGIRIDPSIDTSFPALQWLTEQQYILYETRWQAQRATEGVLCLTPLTVTERQEKPEMLNLLAIPQECVTAFQELFLNADSSI